MKEFSRISQAGINRILFKNFFEKTHAIDRFLSYPFWNRCNVIFMKDFDAPHCPRFVQAVLNKDGVVLRWEKSAAFDLLGYHVYRAPIETGMYQKVNKNAVPGLSFTDTLGVAGSWYKVRAKDTSGNVSRFSPGVAVQKTD